MVSRVVISTEAVYEDGQLRLAEALPLSPGDRVMIQVELPGAAAAVWPADTAEMYRESEAADRELANRMLPDVKTTWPKDETS